MNQKNKIIILLFLTFIFIGGVSAANVDNNTLSHDNDEVVYSDNTSILTVEESSTGNDDSGSEFESILKSNNVNETKITVNMVGEKNSINIQKEMKLPSNQMKEEDIYDNVRGAENNNDILSEDNSATNNVEQFTFIVPVR